MSYTADLHLHSRYAYATSPALTLENLALWAQLKGIDLLATADFTHPAWLQELRHKLKPSGPGIYRFGGAQFILGTEVSCVYFQGGRARRVHLLLLAPDLEAAARLAAALASWGNLESDGRPTLGLSARDLTALALESNPGCMIIPAHLWTPWYGLYGSKTGFDCLEECFGDMSPQIHAVETGLSSDPAMNWPVASLAGKTIVSFSDAHSLPKLGREVTVLEGELSYPGLRQALENNRVEYTVEFYPQEGKYHYNGHRKCGVRQSPEETRLKGGQCPRCRRPLTLGVLHRTGQLSQGGAAAEAGADGFLRPSIDMGSRPPFIRLVPLMEIAGQCLGQKPETRSVETRYRHIIGELGNELNALLRASQEELTAAAGTEIAQAVLRARHGQVAVEPGYDGVYGQVRVWPDDIPANQATPVSRPVRAVRLPGL